MEFIETRLKGAFVVRLKRIEDQRGFFARGFCHDEFLAHGLNANMQQLNIGFSHLKGTVRGLHYQKAPHQEAKFVRCTSGAIYDVAVDLRPDSPTRGEWVGLELTAGNGTMLYAPEGFAHGYQALTDGAEMYYMTSVPYAPGAGAGVRFDDPALRIDWPLAVSVVSDQDRTWPNYVPGLRS